MTKVFSMNDCDWMAADTLEAAVSEYNLHHGGNEEDEPRELTLAEMQKLQFHREISGDPDDRLPWSFQDELEQRIRNGAKFPQFFASTEY